MWLVGSREGWLPEEGGEVRGGEANMMRKNNGGITMPLWGIVLPPPKKPRDPADAYLVCSSFSCSDRSTRCVVKVCFFMGSLKPGPIVYGSACGAVNSASHAGFKVIRKLSLEHAYFYLSNTFLHLAHFVPPSPSTSLTNQSFSSFYI